MFCTTELVVVAAVLGLASLVFPADTYTLWYDPLYDQSATSLDNVVCSTGEYGLITLGYNTFGDLPNFPFIGGAPQILSWNSPNCATCWELTYTDRSGITTNLNMLAINTAQGGFAISQEAMDRFTNGNAQTLDGVSVTTAQLSADECGLMIN